MLNIQNKENSKNKFLRLNFNLKNYIFSYLPFEDNLFNIPTVCKKFSDSIKNKKIIKAFKQNQKKYLKDIEFDLNSINKVKNSIYETSESESTIDDFCTYLLLKKYKNYYTLTLREKKDLYFPILSKFLAKTKNISFVDLYSTDIGINEDNLKYCCEGLSKNSSVQIANLNCNKIGTNSNSMFYISQVLINNKTLKNFYLFGNLIGRNENDLYYFAEALKINSTLEVISLDENKINDFKRNSIFLRNALRINHSLKELQITINEKLNKRYVKRAFKRANKNLRVK